MLRIALILVIAATVATPAAADEQWLVVDRAEGTCFPLADFFPSGASPAAYRAAMERQGSTVELQYSDDQKLAALLNITYRSNTYLAQGNAACQRALAALKNIP